MRTTILIFLIISGHLLFGQVPSFHEHLKSEPAIDTVSLTNDGLTATVLISKISNRNEALVWLITPSSNNEAVFSGYIEGTDSFYFPNEQKVHKSLILGRMSEYDGTILLVNDSTTVEIPGYYYGLSNNAIYTRAAGDGNSTVSHYDLLTGELRTKVWNNTDGPDPWDIDNKYNYEDFHWVQMR